VLALVSVALVLACAPEPGSQALGLGAAGPGPLQLTLRSDRQDYARGEPAILTLTVRNRGSAPVTVTAPSSQLYDFALSRDGTEVWRWSEGKAFLMMISEWTLPPGGAREFSVRWDQRDREGRPVAPGPYVVEARLIGGEQVSLAPAPISITIR
jgi:hypothetical protein